MTLTAKFDAAELGKTFGASDLDEAYYHRNISEYERDKAATAVREAYREAFDNFEIERVARFTAARQEKLLANPGIVRNRAKIASAIGNAQAVLRIRRLLEHLPELAKLIRGLGRARPTDEDDPNAGGEEGVPAGCGCATSGGAGGASGGLLLALGVALGLRRRRRA